ncbi:MAG: transposase [Polyangiaceae bacterium]|nr:transposase [Polyangiaceae bacterium]
MSNVLSFERRLSVLAALVNGNSERAVERMTDVNRRTIRKLALSLGENAIHLHNKIARNLSCPLVQLDEIWSFVRKKQSRVTAKEHAEGLGEAYTFVALDSGSRFVICWKVGKRNEESAKSFVKDLRSRLIVMPAMTSDGFAPYVSAVESSFGRTIDYAMTIKNYTKKGRRDDDYRYEPPRIKNGEGFITKKTVFGAPDLDSASTAYIERQNGTMRHLVGRIRRLCLAFSKDPRHHSAAIALGYLHYNMCHVISTLRVTPAMQLGVTDHVWDLRELLKNLLTAEPCPPPDVQPLASRKPEVAHRELPNGRGFLRAIDGGKSAAKAQPLIKPVKPEKGQLDLFDDETDE